MCNRDLGLTTSFGTSLQNLSSILVSGIAIYSSLDFTQCDPCFFSFLHCLTNTLGVSASVSSDQRKCL